MKKLTLSIITGVGLSVSSAAVIADSVLTNSHRSYVDSPKSKVISSCVKAIRSYHPKTARLFLDQRGTFSTQNGMPVFGINGYVWKNGERVQVTHKCVVPEAGPGLALNVLYSGEDQIADAR